MNNKGFGVNGSNSVIIKGVLFGVITGAMIIAALLCLCAVIFIYSKSLPGQYAEYIMLFIDFLGGLFGGYISARIIKARGILWGGVCGLMLFFIILFAGMSTSDSTLTTATLFKLLSLSISGIIGGIKGVNRKEKIHIK